MNKEDRELTFLLVLVLALGMWLGLLASCSPQYHMAKFIKKGGKIKNDTTLVTVNDTIRINGKDSIIVRTVQAVCPEMQAPKTRFETRNERKTKEDSLKYALKTLKEKNAFTIDSLSKVIKLAKINVKNNRIDSREVIRLTKQQVKSETKNNKTLNLALIVVGLITLTILAFKFSK